MVEDASRGEIAHLAHHAAADPNLWGQVLVRLGERLRAPLVALVEHNFITRQGEIRHAVGIGESFRTLYTARYAAQNVWLHAKAWGGSADALTGAELVPNWDLVRTDFYRSWLRPQRAFHCLIGVLFRCAEEIRCLMALRPLENPAFQARDKRALAGLLPHLRCACELGVQVAAGRREVEILVELLGALPEAVLVVDAEARPMFLNVRAGLLIARGDGLTLVQGALAAASSEETVQLRRLVAAAAGGTNGGMSRHGGEVAISRPSGDPPLVLRIAALHHCSLDRAGRQSFVATIFTQLSEPADAAGHLSQFYHMTRAEARLAALIVSGHSLLEAAAELRVTQNTARTHMKRIYAKTETHRQADLVRLLVNSGMRFY